jgi:glycosyltransferase involved in cell wall biosynthesis
VEPDEEIAHRFPGVPVVGFVGSFQAFHGPEALGRMALLLCEKRSRVGFAFVGAGDGIEVVRRITAPIADRVLFTGRVPHERIPGVVRAMDIGVLPDTAYYCCPLKLLEWMAAGIAVVAPAHEAIREIIEPGVHGELFTPGDTEALVKIVDQLLDDPERRRAIADRAAAHARRSLTWRHNAARVIDVCRTAMGRHAGETRNGRVDCE